MAPRRFSKAKAKAQKSSEPTLNDEDDFLAAANEHEEAMGKHRSGDAAKSLRFARRALDVYAAGALRHPRSLDLAYNKARLELEVATHPAFGAAVAAAAPGLLRQSVASHRSALDLDPANADACFNMAQALTALAERVAEDDDADDADDAEALACLDEALGLQRRCFDLQRESYARSRLQLDPEARHDANGGVPGPTPSSSFSSSMPPGHPEQAEQWVSIVEPVTASSLLDTVLAQMSTLTTLCSILSSALAPGQASSGSGGLPFSSSPISLPQIEACYAELAGATLPALIVAADSSSSSSSPDETLVLAPERLAEAALARAVLAAGLLELSFRAGAVDAAAYRRELDRAFGGGQQQEGQQQQQQSQMQPEPHLDAASSPDALLAWHGALLALHGALADADLLAQSSLQLPQQLHSSLRWSVLVEAQGRLSAASRLLSPPRNASESAASTASVAATHRLRGDASLLLVALAHAPHAHPPARDAAPELLRHARVYYRNAGKLEEDGEEKAVCDVRCALAGGLLLLLLQVQKEQGEEGKAAASSSSSSGDGGGSIGEVRDALLGLARARGEAWVRDQLAEAVEEGLAREGDVELILRG
ncbi:hypothetical protein GGR56DRAFT_687109 [Xylariaceae sp. FL0804]|nr:hypothetical protein GGR56DRAFT_687109 [Xylariaceae sp. FL0804]